MLYNESTGKPKVQADVFSLESLISWLETMPRNKVYDYENCCGECLYGLYAASHGISWRESGGAGSFFSTEERSRFCDLVYEKVANQRPWTFGAALSRARASQGE